MANTSAIWQQTAHTTCQLSSPSCSTRAIQKSLTLNKKIECFLEKSQENGPLAEKWQDRKSKRTRKKRQERRWERGIKWQPWDSREEDDIRHPQPPFRDSYNVYQAFINKFETSHWHEHGPQSDRHTILHVGQKHRQMMYCQPHCHMQVHLHTEYAERKDT